MSSWYRTIDAGMWGDEKFRKLSRPDPSAQFLWVYLLTGEHTEGLPGLYRLGEAALAEALGWSVEDLATVFAELETLGMALRDVNARVIYLPNALRFQGPTNPKHLQGLEKLFRRVPDCELKDQWYQQLVEFAEAMGKPYVDALHASFDRVWHRVSPPNPNPNPNPKPNPRNAESPHGGDDTSGPDEIPYAEIVALLNQESGKRFRHGTEATRRHIRARWRDGYRLEDFEQVIQAKCRQWSGTEMEKYLRPQTLFGSKFESYANERSTGPGSHGSLYPEMDELMEQDDDEQS